MSYCIGTSTYYYYYYYYYYSYYYYCITPLAGVETTVKL